MGKFENNILGLVSQAEWIDVGFEVKRQNDPIDGLFGDIRTDNLMAQWQTIASEYQIPVMAMFHSFDSEAQTTFRVPVDTHNIEKGLIKVKINQSERMRALLRSGIRDDEMYDYVINDGIRLADQVFTRSKVAKNEVMATGEMTINENNLTLTVDYGVPAAQKAYTINFGKGQDVPDQIQTIVDAANEIGEQISGLYTSTENLTKMRNHASIQTAINGTTSVGATVRRTQLNDYLAEEFGITEVITNDLKYGASASIDDATGRPTINSTRYYPKDKLTFFAANPGGQLGVGLWGDPPEADAGDFMRVNTSGVAPYVYVSQWMEKDPAVLWTKASGLFIPVLYNPNSLFIATAANTPAA